MRRIPLNTPWKTDRIQEVYNKALLKLEVLYGRN